MKDNQNVRITPGSNASPSNWAAQAQRDGTHVSYAKAILQALGAPMSDVNVYFLVSWMDREGTSAAWNPLATTVSSGQPGETNFNAIGVKNFPNAAAGINAWVKTIRDGYYPTILNSIMSGNPLASVGAAQEWKSYTGGGNYAQALAQGVAKYLNDPALATGTVGTNTSLGAGGGLATTPTSAGVLAQWGWLLNDPEVGPIIQKAQAQGWTQDEFTAAFQQTQWFRTHSSSVRDWLQTLNEDPATARQQLAGQQLAVRDKAQELGIKLPWETLNGLAIQAQEYGWNDQQITLGVLGTTKVSGQDTGGLGTGEQGIRGMADSYGLNPSDQQIAGYEKQLAGGYIDNNTLQGDFSTQAKALFPNLAGQIDQGMTVTQIAQPYINSASTLLEVDPSQIDIAQPKFQRALAYNDGKNVRQMSQLEWQQTLMSDPTYGWDRTMNARDSAVGLVQQLGQAFGYGN